MKGIILAGGTGSRLHPLTKGVSKQLLPIYDKPMIYYSLSILLLAGIKEILIISTVEDLPKYKNLFGNGDNLGINFEYEEQPSPDGIAQAFIIGKSFIGNDDVSLILGDNIFYGHGLTEILASAVSKVTDKNVATVFGYHVKDPRGYGVITFDDDGNILSIDEKPNVPNSNFVITGLYFYPNDVIKKALKVQPSKRGELEITSINQMYLNENRLNVELMGRGYAWLDTGTHENLLEASSFIEIVERRQGLKIACIEEIAYEKGYIGKKKLSTIASSMKQNQYGEYLNQIIKNTK